jgi:hypothetical protein
MFSVLEYSSVARHSHGVFVCSWRDRKTKTNAKKACGDQVVLPSKRLYLNYNFSVDVSMISNYMNYGEKLCTRRAQINKTRTIAEHCADDD